MNKNQSYYIESFKKHVANQRLLKAIPDFDLVLGQVNILQENYEEALNNYKARLSRLKTVDVFKNSYLTFLNKLLEEKLGFQMAIILHDIKKHIVSQEPQQLQNKIEMFEKLLTKDPTLVSILPYEIMLFINAAKIKKKVFSNIIYITGKHHFSSCYTCDKEIKGNECSILKCLCSTKILHQQCATLVGKRCYICTGTHTCINSSKKNKNLEDDKNNRTGIIERKACHTEKSVVEVKCRTKKETYGISKHKSCIIVNNATLWDDKVC